MEEGTSFGQWRNQVVTFSPRVEQKSVFQRLSNVDRQFSDRPFRGEGECPIRGDISEDSRDIQNTKMRLYPAKHPSNISTYQPIPTLHRPLKGPRRSVQDLRPASVQGQRSKCTGVVSNAIAPASATVGEAGTAWPVSWPCTVFNHADHGLLSTTPLVKDGSCCAGGDMRLLRSVSGVNAGLNWVVR